MSESIKPDGYQTGMMNDKAKNVEAPTTDTGNGNTEKINLPSTPEWGEFKEGISRFWDEYKNTVATKPAAQNDAELDNFYSMREKILDFLQQSSIETANLQSSERSVYIVRERLIDILGSLNILAQSNGDQAEVEKINQIGNKEFGIDKEQVGFDNFNQFVTSSRERLSAALKEHKKVAFVIGHKNPDMDSAIGSLMEAYRNNLLDSDTVYIPVLQSKLVPDEISYLLGNDLSDGFLLSSEADFQKAQNYEQSQWILVDHSTDKLPKSVLSVVDHHPISESVQSQDIAVSQEMAGSAAALVAQKFLGMGIKLDPEMAKIFLGATLMDTENRSGKKMTSKDKLVMNQLQKDAGQINEPELFQEMMSSLLNSNNAEQLFERDYKKVGEAYGFSVIKAKGVFEPNGQVHKTVLINKLSELANEDIKKNNIPFTVIKIVDYLQDNQTVNRERICIAFNDSVTSEIKTSTMKLIRDTIEKEFEGRAQIKEDNNTIDYWGVGDQLSRKSLASKLETIAKAC